MINKLVTVALVAAFTVPMTFSAEAMQIAGRNRKNPEAQKVFLNAEVFIGAAAKCENVEGDKLEELRETAQKAFKKMKYRAIEKRNPKQYAAFVEQMSANENMCESVGSNIDAFTKVLASASRRR